MGGKGIETLKGLETELGNCNLKGRGRKKRERKGIQKILGRFGFEKKKGSRV